MKSISLDTVPGLNPFFIGSTSSKVSVNSELLKDRSVRLGPDAGTIIEQTMRNISLNEKQQNGLNQLLSGKAVAMITGQQPGFLGGPLYSLYKAMSCISLAEMHSTDELSIVPIFWIEDNDHDGVEAGTASLIDQSSAVHTIHCDEIEHLQTHIPICERAFSNDISSLIESISQYLPNSEYGLQIKQEINELYQSGKNWSESFLEYMQERCGEFGLLFFSSSIARKEGLFKERILHEISHSGELQQLVLEANESLMKRGMKIQAEAGIINAFYHDDSGRHKIDIDEFGHIKLGEGILSKDECIKLIQLHPEKFSPSVLLRPLIQDSIIPTIGMIVGPGEFGYMSQLKHAYSALNISMPQLHGRHSVTILIPSISKYLSKHQLEPNFFMRIMNEIEQDLSARFAHDAATDALVDELRSSVQYSLRNISEHAETIDSSLQGAVSATEHGIEKLIDGMQKKMVSSLKKKQDMLFGKAHEAHAWIYPQNHLQERFLSSITLEARVGKEMFRDILIAIKNASRDMHILIDVNEMKSY
jgi:bacillithiol biosynthesis cysteine-adding enzyme BshC